MKIHKDRIIQIVLAIIIIVLIGFVIANNKKDKDITFELTPPEEEILNEAEESEEETEEETVNIPTTPTPAPTQPSESTAVTTPPPSAGSCYPSLSARKEQKFGGILLSWTTCSSDDFQFYKVVKSATNSSPIYPNDTVVASSSNRGTSSYLDKTVARSMTYYYRVCVVERLGKVTCGNIVSMSY